MHNDILDAHATRHSAGYSEITPEDVARLRGRDGLRIVDVREPHEFDDELGHVPGAELVPLRQLAAAAASWHRGRAVLLVCRSGGRSSRAAELLVAMGFTRAVNLRGGMLAYRLAGRDADRAA